MSAWDRAYVPPSPARWDIGRPQPAFARLAERGLLSGHVLDAGCGTGEHALLAATSGADAIGVDVSPLAIARARAKAAQRSLPVRFEVADVLDLAGLGLPVDTVIDSGLFHVLDDAERPRYVASVASVLAPGGSCFVLCISDQEPGSGRPRRVRPDELRAAFATGWNVAGIVADRFDLNPVAGQESALAWLATITRL